MFRHLHLSLSPAIRAGLRITSIYKPKTFFRLTRSYYLKVDLAFAIGLLNSKYYSAFKAINKVRNNYAHKHDYNVILGKLNVFKLDWADIDNKAFSIACRKNYWRGCRYCHNFLCWKTIHLLDKQEDEKRGLRPFFHLRPLLD